MTLFICLKTTGAKSCIGHRFPIKQTCQVCFSFFKRVKELVVHLQLLYLFSSFGNWKMDVETLISHWNFFKSPPIFAPSSVVLLNGAAKPTVVLLVKAP